MNVISYPVITFWNNVFRVRFNETELTTTTIVGLRKGCFKNLLIVDLNCSAFKVKSARKLHGVGPFWGYNIFLNQKIKVELYFEGEAHTLALKDVKDRIFESFRKWGGWEEMIEDDFNELKQRIGDAKSVQEIIDVLIEFRSE